MLKIITRHTTGCNKAKGCGCPLHLHGTINGRRIRESLGTISPSVARRLQQQRELEMYSGRAARRITVSEALDAHRQDMVRRGFAHETLRLYERLGRQLRAELGSRFVEDVSVEDLRALIGRWTQAPRTQGKALERLKSFWRFCVDNEWMDRSPAKALKAPNVNPSIPNPYTKQEIADIFAACNQFGSQGWERARILALVALLRFTGLSIGDAVRLPKSAVRGLEIVTSRKKTHEAVRVPIPPVVLTMLNSFPTASTEFYFWTGLGDANGVARTFQRKLRRVFDLSGVKNASARRFRQTVATELAQFGIEHSQHALGHASVKTTEKIYAGWTRERQQGLQAAAALAFGDEAEALAGASDSSLTHGRKPRAN